SSTCPNQLTSIAAYSQCSHSSAPNQIAEPAVTDAAQPAIDRSSAQQIAHPQSGHSAGHAPGVLANPNGCQVFSALPVRKAVRSGRGTKRSISSDNRSQVSSNGAFQ